MTGLKYFIDTVMDCLQFGLSWHDMATALSEYKCECSCLRESAKAMRDKVEHPEQFMKRLLHEVTK